MSRPVLAHSAPPPRTPAARCCEYCFWFCASELPRDLVRDLKPLRNFGSCRRRPPMLVPQSEETWPTVCSDDYCGAWEKR